MSNVALLNVHFQWMPVLWNVFSYKGKTTPHMINPCFRSPQKTRLQHCKKQVQTFNNAVSPPMLLSCGFWIDWAAAACQQTSSMLTGHSQRPKLDLATNSSEKHFERKINYSCWIWGSNRWMWRVLSSAIYLPCSSAWGLLHAGFLHDLYSLALTAEKTCSSETSVEFRRATWRHIFPCLQRNWTVQLTQWNLHWRCPWGAVDLNTTPRKILNGENSSLTWDHWNWI
jgi:hypothetical protein